MKKLLGQEIFPSRSTFFAIKKTTKGYRVYYPIILNLQLNSNSNNNLNDKINTTNYFYVTQKIFYPTQ